MTMTAIPQAEQNRFANIVKARASTYAMTPEDYLRKVWYHEEASKVGEFVALTMLEHLLSLLPSTGSPETGEQHTDEEA